MTRGARCRRTRSSSPGPRESIDAASRVILSHDGPLWALPFAAVNSASHADPEWLGLDKPLSYASSLTVVALLRESATIEAGRRWILLGDPVFVRRAPERIAQSAPGARPSAGPEMAIQGERGVRRTGRKIPRSDLKS